ncbi:MAG: EamA family transporter [Candidatus Heimdallarchaeota archaeon]|nr:EamA family transporter [Candidatus Heimdallarchaeota archaeon]
MNYHKLIIIKKGLKKDKRSNNSEENLLPPSEEPDSNIKNYHSRNIEEKDSERNSSFPVSITEGIPTHVYLLIVLAIIMTSFASILIRFSGEGAARFGIPSANASVIAFWRLLFATFGMFVGTLVSGNLAEFKKIQAKRDLPLLAASGLALAAHFITWNISLEKTDVASSIVIVYMMPVFSLLLSVIFLKESISWVQGGAMLLSMVGVVLVGVSDWGKGEASLIGDLFALAGGFSGAIYFVIGRKTREKLDIFSYATTVYGFCTIFLLLFNIIFKYQIIQNLTWLHFIFFALLAIGPSCLGHTLYNYSLGYLKTPVVTLSALGEIFGASILAFAFFGEIPKWLALIGMILVAIGIVLTVILENKSMKEEIKPPNVIIDSEEGKIKSTNRDVDER